MENTKQYRVLEIFFRAMRGEDISVAELANEYGVSTKSISHESASHVRKVMKVLDDMNFFEAKYGGE